MLPKWAKITLRKIWFGVYFEEALMSLSTEGHKVINSWMFDIIDMSSNTLQTSIHDVIWLL